MLYRRNRSRKANRKNRRSTRRNRAQKGGAAIFGTLYSPIGHLLNATGEAVGTVTNTVKSIAQTSLRGVNRIGRSVTTHANSAVRNVVSRKRRANSRR
jgi:hypothetical protein